MRDQLYAELVENLNQLVRVYRHLLDVVRKEKQILVKAQITELSENNKSKEKMVSKAKELEGAWMESAYKLYKELNIKEKDQRLLEIARHFNGEKGEKLHKLHSVLTLLVKRTVEINKANDEYIQSALSHISGAMKAIRETLSQNTNYEKAGKKGKEKLETAGRLMSKEV